MARQQAQTAPTRLMVFTGKSLFDEKVEYLYVEAESDAHKVARNLSMYRENAWVTSVSQHIVFQMDVLATYKNGVMVGEE